MKVRLEVTNQLKYRYCRSNAKCPPTTQTEGVNDFWLFPTPHYLSQYNHNLDPVMFTSSVPSSARPGKEKFYQLRFHRTKQDISRKQCVLGKDILEERDNYRTVGRQVDSP